MEANENKINFLKVLLWISVVYHIFFALVGMFGKPYVPTLASIFYGFNLTMTDSVAWILNPVATYMLAFGLFMGIAATDPLKYKHIVYAALVIILIRIVQRIYFLFSTSGEIIAGNPTRILTDIIGSTIFWLALLWAAKKATCPKCQ